MTEIIMPVFAMRISIMDDGSGSIGSNLKVGCKDPIYNAAMDAIESIILAHVCAGVDVLDPGYIEGIETAVEACGNNL